MVTILPKYTGWEAERDADKPKPRLIMRCTVVEAQAMDLEELKCLCEHYDLTLSTDGTHYEVRPKA